MNVKTKQLFADLSQPKRASKAKLSLGSFTHPNDVDLEVVLEMLRDDETEHVFWALVVLERLSTLGAKLDQYTEEVARLEHHGAVRVRQSVIATLGRIAPQSALLRPLLVRRAEDHDEFVQCAALRELERIGVTPDDIVILKRLSDGENQRVAMLAQDLLSSPTTRPQ